MCIGACRRNGMCETEQQTCGLYVKPPSLFFCFNFKFFLCLDIVNMDTAVSLAVIVKRSVVVDVRLILIM